MNPFFGSVFWLLVTLGVLVTFHEFGHYWVARRCGVKVLRFSVGFGKAIWKRIGRDGTEYQVAMIPLGGYVKMLDAREGDVDPALRRPGIHRQAGVEAHRDRGGRPGLQSDLHRGRVLADVHAGQARHGPRRHGGTPQHGG